MFLLQTSKQKYRQGQMKRVYDWVTANPHHEGREVAVKNRQTEGSGGKHAPNGKSRHLYFGNDLLKDLPMEEHLEERRPKLCQPWRVATVSAVHNSGRLSRST